MTKNDLVKQVARRYRHMSARDADVVVNVLFEAIGGELARGGRVEVRGFGSFSVRRRRSRLARNPKTGDRIAVPRKRVPLFTVGHELRTRLSAAYVPGESVARRDTVVNAMRETH